MIADVTDDFWQMAFDLADRVGKAYGVHVDDDGRMCVLGVILSTCEAFGENVEWSPNVSDSVARTALNGGRILRKIGICSSEQDDLISDNDKTSKSLAELVRMARDIVEASTVRLPYAK